MDYSPCLYRFQNLRYSVSFYHYIRDRVCGAYEMPALATLITERAKEINLGASWNSS